MNQKPKFDFIAVLVYLAMFGLVAIIALPPILRMLLPKNDVELVQQEEIKMLICNKQMNIEGADISVRTSTTYKNDTIFRVILNYTKEENEIPEEEINTDIAEQVPPEGEDTKKPFDSIKEITDLKNVSGVEVTQDENKVKIDIVAKVFDAYPDDELLAKYNQSLTSQQTIFEEEGYICQVANN